jgi:uncharacterized protein
MTMEQILGLSLALLVMLAGLLGSIVPVLPSTPLVLVAAIVHRLCFGAASVSNAVLLILVALTLFSILLDFLAGMLGARKFGATWLGVTGAMVGGIIGLFFSLPGMIVGPFLGAMLFEMLGGREFKKATAAGVGATIGLLLGIVAKFSICVVMIILFATDVIYRS